MRLFLWFSNTLILFSICRYKAVCRPFSVSHSKKTANWIIISIWILSIAFAVPMVIFHQFTYSKDSHGIKPFCTPYKITHKVVQSSRNTTQKSLNNTEDEDRMEPYDIYMLVLLFYQYFIPLLILAFVYGKMSVILWEAKTPGNADDERDKNIFLQKKKSVKMMVTVVVTFGLCWLPWHAFHCAKLVWPEVLGYVRNFFCLRLYIFLLRSFAWKVCKVGKGIFTKLFRLFSNLKSSCVRIIILLTATREHVWCSAVLEIDMMLFRGWSGRLFSGFGSGFS